MAKKDELARVEPAGPLTVPDFLKEVKGHEGFESMTARDLVLPRISIAQSLTPQLKRNNPLFIEGLEEGQFFNNVTQEVLGAAIEITPLVFSKSRIYFREMNQGGGILCQSNNGIDGGTISPTCDACPNSRFSDDGTPPICTDFLNVAALLLPTRHIVVLSFKSTSLKAARKWMTQSNMLNKPAYCQRFSITAVPEKRQSNDFFSIAPPKFLGWVETEKDYLSNKGIFDSIKGKVIAAADEHEEDEAQEGVDSNIPF